MKTCPRNPTEAKKAGAVFKDGNWYNEFGVCLDCNGWNLECTHNNLVEESGVTKCAMCGLVIK